MVLGAGKAGATVDCSAGGSEGAKAVAGAAGAPGGAGLAAGWAVVSGEGWEAAEAGTTVADSVVGVAEAPGGVLAEVREGLRAEDAVAPRVAGSAVGWMEEGSAEGSEGVVVAGVAADLAAEEQAEARAEEKAAMEAALEGHAAGQKGEREAGLEAGPAKGGGLVEDPVAGKVAEKAEIAVVGKAVAVVEGKVVGLEAAKGAETGVVEAGAGADRAVAMEATPGAATEAVSVVGLGAVLEGGRGESPAAGSEAEDSVAGVGVRMVEARAGVSVEC